MQPYRQYTHTVLEFVRAPCEATAPTAVAHNGFGTAEAQTANWFATVVQRPPGKQTRYSRPGTNLWWHHTRASTTNSARSGNRRCRRRVHLCGRGLSQCELAWRFVLFSDKSHPIIGFVQKPMPCRHARWNDPRFSSCDMLFGRGSTSCTRARLLGSRVACNPCAYGAGTVNPEPTTAQVGRRTRLLRSHGRSCSALRGALGANLLRGRLQLGLHGYRQQGCETRAYAG